MDVIYGKNNLNENMLIQINNLFAMNYTNYHYTNFINLEETQKLIRDETFDCVCICDNNVVIGFAGYYDETNNNSSIKLYKLAHLLVDNKCRGRGLGSLLEDNRLMMVNSIAGEKVIYASCVENPRNSIYMKLNRGFRINGFKYCYRNAYMKRDNSLILVNSDAIIRKKQVIVNTSNYLTRRILKSGNADILFTCSNNEKVEQLNSGEDKCNCRLNDIAKNYVASISFDEVLGRSISRIESFAMSSDDTINEILPDITKVKYNSIIVNPSISGFDKLDNHLLKNSFYPVSYIPYINNYYGELEYQYLPYGMNEILEDVEVSDKGKEFIRKLYDDSYNLKYKDIFLSL